nr:IS630 family transposase [Alteromonas macleodii]
MHTADDFKQLAKQTSNGQLRTRYLALYHFKKGETRTQIAAYLGVARGSVNTWVSNYLAHGLEGLQSKPSPGRPCQLSVSQREQIAHFIKENAVKKEGGRLIAQDVRQYISDTFQIDYQLRNVYRIMDALGFSWITSRSKHPKQSQQTQDTFKKNFLLETILHTPGHLPLDRVDVWFQDEARFGQQNQTSRIWAAKGSRPRVVKQQQFDYGYVFGAVCPSNGNTQALISPLVNKEVMKQHLKLISEATEPGRHAVVVMDGAGWHTIDTASPFTNVSLLKLPPYSPELNPMEQVWQWLRQRCLSNRVFRGYEEIVEQVSRAWNTFIADVERVKNLCWREWIKLVN